MATRASSGIAIFGFVVLFTITLFLGCMAVMRADATQDVCPRLQEIAIPEQNRYEDYEHTTIRAKILMPDGTAPGQSYYLPYSYAPTIRQPLFPFGKRTQNWHGIYDGGTRYGEPFEFEAIVGSNVLLMVKSYPERKPSPEEIGQATSPQRGVSSFGDSSGGFQVGHFRESLGSMMIPKNLPSNVIVPPKTKYDEIYFTKPHAFFAKKENDDIVLHLEKATPIIGTVRYDNGEPAAGAGIGAKQFVPPARGADIPEMRDHSLVSVDTYADENGNFELPVWSGEFTLFAGGTEWSEHVTKMINVEQGKPVEVDLTIPTPLRIHLVLPDGSPVESFSFAQLTVHGRSSWNTTTLSFVPDVQVRIGYYLLGQSEHPIVINLSNKESYAENYIAVMTADNEYGIVRKLEPELMGKDLTLTLQPTIAGTVKLTDGSKRPVANRDVSIWIRLMKMDNNGESTYAEQSGNFAPKLWFRTDAEGRGNFKVPVFEGIDDSVSLFFNEGASEYGSSIPMRTNDSFRNLEAERRFKSKMFRSPSGGTAFDLGVMEVGKIER